MADIYWTPDGGNRSRYDEAVRAGEAQSGTQLVSVLCCACGSNELARLEKRSAGLFFTTSFPDVRRSRLLHDEKLATRRFRAQLLAAGKDASDMKVRKDHPTVTFNALLDHPDFRVPLVMPGVPIDCLPAGVCIARTRSGTRGHGWQVVAVVDVLNAAENARHRRIQSIRARRLN
jgi:hypothetical protein